MLGVVGMEHKVDTRHIHCNGAERGSPDWKKPIAHIGEYWGRGRQEEKSLLQRELPLPESSPPSIPSAFIPVLSPQGKDGECEQEGWGETFVFQP